MKLLEIFCFALNIPLYYSYLVDKTLLYIKAKNPDQIGQALQYSLARPKPVTISPKQDSHQSAPKISNLS